MSDKQLKDKTINIQGKKYVMVKDRLIYFNEQYPKGTIETKLLSEPTNDLVIMKARVWPDCEQLNHHFDGTSQAIVGGKGVNMTSALENAETSAVGRALAMMGIGVLDSVASGDEINKALTTNTPRLVTQKQVAYLRNVAGEIIDSEDLEEINGWLEQILKMNPEDIIIYKFNDALELVKAQKAVKRDAEDEEYAKLEKEVMGKVTDQDMADFDAEKIPF